MSAINRQNETEEREREREKKHNTEGSLPSSCTVSSRVASSCSIFQKAPNCQFLPKIKCNVELIPSNRSAVVVNTRTTFDWIGLDFDIKAVEAEWPSTAV